MKETLVLTTVLLTLTTFLFGHKLGAIGTQGYYSEHAGGAAPPNSEYFNIFPNPFQNQLTVQSEQPIERIELNDNTGRRILSSRPATLSLENHNNGVYFLTIYLKSGQRLDRKIIKNAL